MEKIQQKAPVQDRDFLRKISDSYSDFNHNFVSIHGR